jgi:hypothetical protein
MQRWHEYISELYNDDSRGDIPIIHLNEEILPITKEEIEFALSRLPDNKAPGPDNIVAEMLKAAGENYLELLRELANRMYREGSFPRDLNKSLFIKLPKVNGTLRCDKHRTLSLMSHVIKLMIQVIIKRVKGRTIHEISPIQYGFMPNKGTNNAIFVMRRLIERSIEKQRNVCVCFIDYTKAFDTVKHEKLIDVLSKLDVDKHDIRLLSNLYWNQQATVRHNNELSNTISIKRGVRQGCVASPHLFVLYTEMIMRSIDSVGNFKVGGTIINNLRYADDTAIIAESESELQHLMNIIVEESETNGLFLNSAKSFTMVFSKMADAPACNITVHGKRLEQVESFNYLGSLLTSDGRCIKEVKRRIGIAKSTFNSMKKVLTSREISMKVRIRVLKCYVWSTLFYGCESWVLTKELMKKLEATEMWFLRRMQRISWKEKITNEEVKRRAQYTPHLLHTVTKRQLSFFGHVMRKEEFEHLVTTGFIDGKKARGRPRQTFLTYLQKITNIAPLELLKLTREKDRWKEVCNCRLRPTGHDT